MSRSPVLQARGSCVWTAKRKRERWQDAVTLDFKEQRFAVADGASNLSYASQRWAQTLTDAYVGQESQSPASFFAEALLNWTNWQPGNDLDDLKAQGSFATFLGVNLVEIPGGSAWTAVSIGDCCMFVVRNERLHQSFPMSDPSDFSSRPTLVSSRWTVDDLMARSSTATGELLSGDTIFLATDELAKWILGTHLGAPEVWGFLANVDQAQLQYHICRERQHSRMDNDDITLVRLGILE